MTAPRSVSVLMPTWQGEEFLERVLGSLAEQVCECSWDLWIVDSGSSDRTLEIVRAWRERFPVPLHLRHIHKVEFDHGDTRNWLAAMSAGELLVFLTQDAIPKGRDWLAKLCRNFEDERVGAAYCRNVPRPDADLLTRVFSEGDPGYVPGRREVRLPARAEYADMSAHDRRLLYNFNDVASAVRRELWERHPFPRTAFGEDLLMARALLEAGFTVVYDDEAQVEHSHDYEPDEMRARAEIDAKFNAEWLDRICVGSRSDADVLVGRQLERDREALAQHGSSGAELEHELKRARELRRAAFHGLYEGGRSTRRFAPTAMRERTGLKLLYVVHGFPPDTWAGTEVYTLNLAQEMRRRGHECVVLTRAPAAAAVADGGPADFSLEEGEFDGLRVWRMVHRLAHERLRDSYDQPRAEAPFRELLLREKPDVVHFQHLIHTSAGLVRVARELGLPTVLTCHDYWAVCARVQLIRPDGVRCESNMKSGCFLCVKERGLAHVPRMARLDAVAGGLLDALAAGLRSRGRSGKGTDRWEGFADLRARQDFVLEAYASADLRISPSRFLRAKLLESGAFDPHTFLFSDNGMRTDHVRALEKQPDPDGKVRFGFVGSLVWYKGGEVMVRAMNALAGTRAVLNVYGDFKPDQDEHHAELQKLANADNVVFKGRFDNQRLSEVYAEIDVLVVPSVWFENSPITIHEAFLTNTPVVASDIGGMAEFVRDGVDGLHFAVGDAADLARVLRRFVDEPQLVEQLSRDFMTVKTIEENAREMEFRYRALCCVERQRTARLSIERAGIDTSSREGAVEQQGADMALLRPGSAVAYAFDAIGNGVREVEVELFLNGLEPDLVMGGSVRLGGREVGELEPCRAESGDELRSFRWCTEFAEHDNELSIRAAEGKHLRIRRVVVREPEEASEPAGGAGTAAGAAGAAGDRSPR